MKRRMFNLAAATSLVLCLATAVLWVRSYYVRDIINLGRSGGNSHTIQSILGRLHLISHLSGGRASGDTFYSSDRLSPNAIWNGGMSGYPARVQWHLGCVWQRYSKYHLPIVAGGTGFSTERRLVVVPYRWLTLLLAVLPAVSLAQALRRRSRGGRSCCEQCGYDLCATPDRRPECGTVANPMRAVAGAVGCNT